MCVFSKPAARWLVALGICGLFVAGVTGGPASVRFAQLLARRLGSEATFSPGGSAQVETLSLSLSPRAGADLHQMTIPVQLWFPSTVKCGETDGGKTSGETCQGSDPGLGASRSRFPVLLYAPGLRGPHDDNAMTAADLASHGYVVVAMDDIDWKPTIAGVSPNFPNDFDMSSPEAFRAMLQHLDSKIRQQARRASVVIDRLASPTTQASLPWLAHLNLETIGFFGWSFGGATAEEASIADPRIVASVNMDGWLFGDAAAGRQIKPSMTLLSDYAAPRLDTLSALDFSKRYNAMMDLRDLREKIRLGLGQDGYFIRIPGAIHENYADKIFDLSHWRAWLRADPYATKRKVDEDLVEFFDHYIAQPPGPHPTDARPSVADIHYYDTSKDWLDWPKETSDLRTTSVPGSTASVGRLSP